MALRASLGEKESLENWLGGLARRESRDNFDSFFVFPAEIVSNVVIGLEGALLDLTLEEQSDVLAANQFFYLITFLRDMAMDWAVGVSAAPTAIKIGEG